MRRRAVWWVIVAATVFCAQGIAQTGDGPPRSDGPAMSWNLKVAPTPGHTGNVLLRPDGQLHEGPGQTGLDEAVNHWHPRDLKTGELEQPGIPLDKNGGPIREADRVRGGVSPSTQAATPDRQPSEELLRRWTASVTPPLEAALLAQRWEKLAESLVAPEEALLSPVIRLLLGHACLALNRNNESFALLLSSSAAEIDRDAWRRWTSDFIARHPDNPVALYVSADAHARCGEWEAALPLLNRALEQADDFALALDARAVVYAALEQWDAAKRDLWQLTEHAPEFVDGHLSLGTLWVQRTAPEGAQAAFEAALKLQPRSFLGLNGRACAAFGQGRWDAAGADFAAAARLMVDPFPAGNLRAVAVAAEDCQLPDQQAAPEFRVADFFDWDALRELTRRPEDLMRVILGGSELPLEPTDGVIARLNDGLKQSDLFDRHRHRLNLEAAGAELGALIERTAALRRKPYSELGTEDQLSIRAFNRLLIELTYPVLIASHRQRDPGMQLTMKAGLMDMHAHRQTLSTPEIRAGQHRIDHTWRTLADAASMIPLAGPALSNQWNRHLDQATRFNNMALAGRGIPEHQRMPGGVSADLRRAYVDRGNWPVGAPFGLAYVVDRPEDSRSSKR